ncbi:MAG: hypothetical protein JWN14_1136 [Chthonomonadales bacterium]|nr:hypothetical protein [Chthonomonadales bacterium]
MRSDPSFPHNTWQRRLRRRNSLDYTQLLGVAFMLPPAICSLSWLLHGPLWLTFATGVLWGIFILAITASMTLGLVVTSKARPQTLPFSARLNLLCMIILQVATLLALSSGHVDWAFYLMFGLPNLTSLLRSQTLSFDSARNIVFGVALCLAFAHHVAWLIIPLLLLQYLQSWFFKPGLKEMITKLPTRAEYLERSREACSTGGG